MIGAFALCTLLCALAPGSRQESWTERVGAASTTAELELLIAGMERELAAGEPQADLARAYVDATCACVAYAQAAGDGLARLRERARDAARRSGTNDDVLRVDLEYARTLAAFGDTQLAERELARALEVAPATEHIHVDSAVLLARLALAHCELDLAQERIDRARRDAGVALELARASASPAAPGITASLVAQRCEIETLAHDLATKLGLPDRAAHALDDEERALAELHASGATDVEAEYAFTSDRAAFLHSVLDFQGATDALRALDPVPFDDAGARSAQQRLRQGLVWMDQSALERNAPDAARAELTAVLELPELAPALRMRAWLALAALALRSGDAAVASAHLAQARAISSEAHDELSRACDARADEFEFTALETSVALARRVPRDELERHAARLRAAFGTWLETWLARRPRTSGAGPLYFTHARRGLGALVDVELALDQTEAGIERAFEHVLRLDAAGSIARVLGAPPANTARVRAQLLGPSEGVLAYLSGDEHGHVFAIDRAGIAHATVPPWTALHGEGEKLGHALAAPALGDDRRARDELALRLRNDVLPEPLRTRVLGWTGAYVVGASTLSLTAFEALPGRKDALGLELDLAHLPSLSAGLELARRVRAETSQPELDLTLLVGGGGSPQLAREHPAVARALPFDDEEDRAIRALRPASRVRVVLPTELTRAEFRRAASAPARVTAILAHGLHDARRETPACLVVASTADDPAGLVDADDVLALESAPRCVLLLACQAGRGPLRFGDDASMHLGGAFLARGTACVASSPADVDYAAMRVLLETFVEELVDHGASPAAALRRARVRLASSSSRSDAFYWSRVAAHGAGLVAASAATQRVDRDTREGARDDARQRSTSPWIWILAAAGAGSVAIALVRRTRAPRA